MDKNTLIGFGLIGAVVIGFSIYNRPSEAEVERAKRYQDSIQTVARVEAEKKVTEQLAAVQSTATLDTTSLFYTAAAGTEKQVTLENDLVKLTLSNKGARVTTATLKAYNGQDGNPLILFDESDSQMNFAFEGKSENIVTENLYFNPINVTDSTVTMRLATANGGYIDFDYK
ncbi:MAG: YidC/Oxa1 family insertase periplasmic-domain containing protein, partial [Phocaeicola sp.]